MQRAVDLAPRQPPDVAALRMSAALRRERWLAWIAFAGVDALAFLVLRTFDVAVNVASPVGAAAGALAVSTVSRQAGELRDAPRARWIPLVSWIATAALQAALLGGAHEAPPTVTLVLVALVGAAFVAGTSLLRSAAGPVPDARWRGLAWFVIGASFLLRLAYVPWIHLLPEEAYYWNYARHPALGYLDHPPMIAWLIAVGTRLFGTNEAGVRAGAFLCAVVAATFAHALTYRLHGRRSALVALALAASLPAFAVFGFFATPDAPLIAAWSGTLFFLHEALFRGSARAWAGVGVCAGLGLLSKYTMALLAPGVLLFLLVDPDARRWLSRPHPYVAAAIALAVFSPVLVWNARNDWASFAFQGPRRISEPFEFSVHAFALHAVLLVTPAGLAATWFALSRRGLERARLAGTSRSYVTFATCTLAAPLAVFLWFSVSHEPKGNWSAPAWIAVLPPLAAAISRSDTAPPWFLRAGTWRATLLLTPLALGVAFQLLATGLPGVTLDSPGAHVPVAWREVGNRLRSVLDAVEQETGRAPMLIGCDQYLTSSELAFYSRRAGGPDEVTGRHVFGRSSVMYARWHPTDDLLGRPLIAVDFDRDDLERTMDPGCFERLGPLQRGVARRRGVTTQGFYYRVGYGYLGPPTAEAPRANAADGPAPR